MTAYRKNPYDRSPMTPPQERKIAQRLASQLVSGLDVSTQIDLMSGQIGQQFGYRAMKDFDDLSMSQEVSQRIRMTVVDFLVKEILDVVGESKRNPDSYLRLKYGETEGIPYITSTDGSITVRLSERLDLSLEEDRDTYNYIEDEIRDGKVSGTYAGVSWEVL